MINEERDTRHLHSREIEGIEGISASNGQVQNELAFVSTEVRN